MSEQRDVTALPLREPEGKIPWGVLDMARFALEVARPDTKEGGVVRREVDVALHYLEKIGARLP